MEIPDGAAEIPEGLEVAPFKFRNVPFHRVDARDHTAEESDRASVTCPVVCPAACPAAGVYKACCPVAVHPACNVSVKNRIENFIQITNNRRVLRVGRSRIMGSIFYFGLMGNASGAEKAPGFGGVIIERKDKGSVGVAHPEHHRNRTNGTTSSQEMELNRIVF
jgi:hypothetical protein